MVGALATRQYVVVPLCTAAAMLLGLMVAVQPVLAIGLVGAVAVTLLAFLAPVANLCILLFLTAIVPYGLQNRYGLGGGAGSPGLLVSDALLMAGLARTVLVLAAMPLTRRERWAITATSGFLAIAFLQFFHGLLLERAPSDVGAELRVLLGLGGVILMAIPILADPDARDRLWAGLAVVGLLLGLWGLIQWTVDIPFADAGDAGIRAGILQTTSGRGQIQGGLFSFPVGTLMSAAALTSGAIRRPLARWTLLAVFITCTLGLLLTYERTFWVSTAAALVYVAMRARGSQRIKAIFGGLTVVLVAFAILGTVSPNTLGAARERLLSLGGYQSDNSLRYRVTETRHVVKEIGERPLGGSGLAATIYWGRPWQQVPPETEDFVHNGYLWIAWKLGIPAALVLFGLLLGALLAPAPRTDDPLLESIRTGAKASLFALLLTSITFPSFTSLSASAVVGLLTALAWLPLPERVPRASDAAPFS